MYTSGNHFYAVPPFRPNAQDWFHAPLRRSGIVGQIMTWVAVLTIGLAAAICAGLLYQWLGRRRDVRLYPPPGRMIPGPDGGRTHIHEAGEGGPTVILEAGLAATSLNWRGLHQRLSAFTRCVAYDRRGLGWSDPCSTPRTPEQIAAELRETLRSAGIEPPYVLVGHSFGGFVVRAYAVDFPEDVAGIVLVDPATPEEVLRQRHLLRAGIRLSRRAATLARLGLVRFGAASLMAGSRRLPRTIGRFASGQGGNMVNRIAAEVAKLPRETWPLIAAHWSNPASFRGIAAHFQGLLEAAGGLHRAPIIRGIPVTILTAGKKSPRPREELEAIAEDARHIVASGSGHWIHLDQPELVIESIREAVETQQVLLLRRR